MQFFIITTLKKDISQLDLAGIILGHIIFAIAITQLFDWQWLKDLMSEEDKQRMLKSYNWKDLLFDGAIIAVFLGIVFVVISFFL